MVRKLAFALAVVCVAGIAASSAAQPLGTDLIGGALNRTILRVTPGGSLSTVGSFSAPVNMITMDNDNYHFIALLNGSPKEVVRIDPISGSIVATVWSGAPLTGAISWVEVDQDGDYLVAMSRPNVLLEIAANGASLSTVYQGSTSELFNAFTEDRVTGNWIIGDFTAKAMIVVDRGSGTVTTVTPLGSSSLQGMVQDPHGADIFVATGAPSPLIGFDPVANVTSIVASLSLNSNTIGIDRAPAGDGSLVHLSSTAGSISKFTRSGVSTGSAGAFGTNLAGVMLDRNRNVAPVLQQAPNDRVVRISFPNSPGRAFGFALSVSGYFPGLPVGGRVLPLVPDSVFLATAQGPLAPILTGNAGILGANGEAFVRFNVNALGNSVSGVRVWGAAITLDPAAPLGIAEISAPVLFVL